MIFCNCKGKKCFQPENAFRPIILNFVFLPKTTVMETLIIQAEGKHLSEIKSYLNKLNIQFTVEEAQPPYNPDFVEKIRESEEDYKNGRFTRVNSTDELKALLQGE
jgi:hypothetical protein